MTKQKERINIVIAGRTNAGKSSLLNLLSGQKDFAIVDETPGTTADTVKTVMEIHDFGPVKVFDTAGVDEFSELGDKKRMKTFEAIDEGDLVVLVVDERSLDSRSLARDDNVSLTRNKSYAQEIKIIERAHKKGKQILIIYNNFQNFPGKISDLNINENFTFERAHKGLGYTIPSLKIDISNFNEQRRLIEFIKNNFKKESRDIQLLPFLKGSGYVLMNIPMDEETPKLRLLRPQDMALERLLRKFFTPVLYRMDLKKARCEDSSASLGMTNVSLGMTEKQRFLQMVDHLAKPINQLDQKNNLKLIITDSQAMDIMAKWTPPNVQLTTFSIMMTDYMSNGNLNLFVDGLKVIPILKNGDTILIAEACNHDRKAEDIGTVQLPRMFKEKLKLNLNFEYSDGRVFPDEKSLKKYKLIIHCGGCMIDKQKYMARVESLKELKIPITNYGVLLSYFQGEKALAKVLEPWNLIPIRNYDKIDQKLK